MPYGLIVFFSVLRLVLFYVILFAWIGPKFLKHAKNLKGIDKMLHAWLAIGGTILITIYILTVIHMYDLISLFVVLMCIPLVAMAVDERRRGTEFRDLLKSIENKVIASHLKVLESIKDFSFKGLRNRFVVKKEFSIYKNRFNILAILIGLVACVVRIIPVINNPSPITRNWYTELEGIKNLRLQQYFYDTPIPKGLHSIVGMFSSLTQVGPELTLSLLGSLTGFLLTVIIFWIIREITKTNRTAAPLFGASIFALFPTIFLPISLQAENGTHTIALALTFAIPTAFIFLRNIRNIDKAPWFYVTMGIIATGLTDIFVLLMVLLPFMVYGMLALPSKQIWKNIFKVSGYLLNVFLIALSPYFIYLIYHQLNVASFFEERLLNSLVFSYFPNLIADIEILSSYYLIFTGVLFIVFLILNVINKRKHFVDIFVFFALTASIAFLYSSFNVIHIPFLDLDQLNVFYAILLSALAGIGIHALFTTVSFIFKPSNKAKMIVRPIVVVTFITAVYISVGGLNFKRILPQTMPDGFYNAYYQIINERLPFSYATVSPSVDEVLSQNRHYYLSYEYFIENYSLVDSLYYEYLNTPEELRPKDVNIPPASIFIFVQKPPYNSIQQGILYNSELVMNQIEAWISDYKELPGRKIVVFEETDDAIIYELINRETESQLSDILMNIYPKKEGRAAKLFK